MINRNEKARLKRALDDAITCDETQHVIADLFLQYYKGLDDKDQIAYFVLEPKICRITGGILGASMAPRYKDEDDDVWIEVELDDDTDGLESRPGMD